MGEFLKKLRPNGVGRGKTEKRGGNVARVYRYAESLKESEFWGRYGGIFLAIIVVLAVGTIFYSRHHVGSIGNTNLPFGQDLVSHSAQNNLAQIPPWFDSGKVVTQHVLLPGKNSNDYQSQDKKVSPSIETGAQGKNALLRFGPNMLQTPPATPEKFTIKAQKGQGITHLARKALGQYLESVKPGISLAKEHKIYIEDYLRRAMRKDRLRIGDELTFSQQAIEQAIQKAQGLSSSQLHHLTRYANRVPSLARYP